MEISGGIFKNDDISAAAFHRFISQPASGRSSALPCLAAILVLSEIWRLLRLHGLFFETGKLKVAAETGLSFLAYNFRRVVNLIGVNRIMTMIKT